MKNCKSALQNGGRQPLVRCHWRFLLRSPCQGGCRTSRPASLWRGRAVCSPGPWAGRPVGLFWGEPSHEVTAETTRGCCHTLLHGVGMRGPGVGGGHWGRLSRCMSLPPRAAGLPGTPCCTSSPAVSGAGPGAGCPGREWSVPW